MNSQKLKLQFHPRKLSDSKSKEKYSPYRISKKKGKNGLLQLQNQQRIDLNQPLVKFQRLILTSSSKRELKLSVDPPQSKNQSQQEKQCDKNPLTPQKCHFCLNFGKKIDQQTHLLKRNYGQIVKRLDLKEDSNPNTLNNQEYQHKISQIVENQHFMIKYLQEQRQKSVEEKQNLKISQQYEKEIAQLKITILEWQLRYKTLQLELSLISSQLAEKDKELQALTKFIEPTNSSNFTDFLEIIKEPTKDCNDQDEILEKSQGEKLKEKLLEIQQRWKIDFDKILTEFGQLKLQNEMLRQEIKLMFYQYNQKYRNEPKKVKMALLNQTSKRTVKSLNNKKVNSSNNQVSIEENISKDAPQKKVIRKRTNSFLISSREKLQLQKQSEMSNDLAQNQIDSFPEFQTRIKTAPNSFFDVPQLKRMNTIQQQKINMAKSFLKWNQESFMSKDEKDKIQKQKKQLNNYTQNKMSQLDLIKRTIFHRFRAYKFTYYDLQAVLINRQQYNIKYQQMFHLLIQPPFSLEPSTAQILISHIFREYDIPLEKIQVFNSFFCNSLRQFISDYQIPEQQQQIKVIQKIKKKIFMQYNRLKDLCFQYSDFDGFINEQKFTKILQGLKFNDLQISIIISQCCLISKDADNLNHQQYLSIFSNNKS